MHFHPITNPLYNNFQMSNCLPPSNSFTLASICTIYTCVYVCITGSRSLSNFPIDFLFIILLLLFVLNKKEQQCTIVAASWPMYVLQHNKNLCFLNAALTIIHKTKFLLFLHPISCRMHAYMPSCYNMQIR